MTRYGYLRVSTDMQDHDSQKHQIAAKHAVDVWIEDTGTGRILQPNLLRLMALAKDGDQIIVAAFDRLGRNMAQSLNIMDTFKRKNVSIISIREGVDLSTPAGMMAFHMLTSIAQYEVSIISDRVKRGLDAARARGVRVGKPPYSTNARMNEALQYGSRLRVEGYSYYKIADKLEEKFGHRFSYGTVRRYVIDNPFQ